MKTTAAIRSEFLSYFAERGHEVVRSSPLVPQSDPSLLFTNAGMVQFKDVFTGKQARAVRRACSSQKCVRAGGKHNDLENVGRTARHHTFFEMLGNFSFGDYFKAEAIEYAWDLLTRVLGLDRSRLCATVFGGDPTLGLGADDEARALWRKIAGLSDQRILGLGLRDNFWAMGETGPQGPCSEIHFHQGDHLPCSEPRCLGPACDCDRWIEIWNLVFMQFEKATPDSALAPLPAPSVDTGMGLERVAAVLQGKTSNYDTDLLLPLIELAGGIAGQRYGADAEDDVSMRVIADHARATAFLVADGVFPDKNGRQYVLRRIFRRAVRHGQRLGIEQPFMHRVCAEVGARMGDEFPELRERQSVIEQLTLEEEKRFRATLERGLRMLDEEVRELRASGGRVIAGNLVFKLYDTYGFPADLTAVIAAEQGLSIDEAGFAAEMDRQRERGEFAGSGETAVAEIYKGLAGELGSVEFLGYQTTRAHSKVRALLVDGARVERASSGQKVAVVTAATPFYGEAGGQVGDNGCMAVSRGGEAAGGKLAGSDPLGSKAAGEVRIDDTQRPLGELIVHLGEVVSGELRQGDEVELSVDGERRQAIRRNHSATHLLHHALRSTLGTHVAQKGSLVAADRLRFDFSHFAPLSDDERRRVENAVNRAVLANQEVRTAVCSYDQARQRGAMALFGEKYGERVRMVQIGEESVELCGGTHVARSGDIGLFRLLSESGIAQGVRRIEAVTGLGALELWRRTEAELTAAARLLRGGLFEVEARVGRLQRELRERERELGELSRKLAGGNGHDPLEAVREVGGVRVLASRVELRDPRALREIGDKLRDRLESGVLALGGVADGKVSLLVMVTKDLVGRLHAGELVAAAAAEVGGRGGGRPDMAQAGGSQPERLDAALDRVVAMVGERAGE